MVVRTDFLSFRSLRRRVFYSAHPNPVLCRWGERFCVSVLFIRLASRLLPHYAAFSLVQMLFSTSSRGGRRKKKNKFSGNSQKILFTQLWLSIKFWIYWKKLLFFRQQHYSCHYLFSLGIKNTTAPAPWQKNSQQLCNIQFIMCNLQCAIWHIIIIILLLCTLLYIITTITNITDAILYLLYYANRILWIIPHCHYIMHCF